MPTNPPALEGKAQFLRRYSHTSFLSPKSYTPYIAFFWRPILPRLSILRLLRDQHPETRLFILYLDVWKALWFTNPATGTVSFGIGVGTLVLTSNCVLLSAYLFGCHSLRHVVGGCVDQFSRAPLGLRAYSCVSCLNRKHMAWAWFSLLSVGFSDLYVRLCSMGVWSDLRIW